MTKRRAIRLIAPVAVGPALVGIVLLHRSGSEQDQLHWEEDDESSLVKASRRSDPVSPGFVFELREPVTARQPASVRAKIQARSTTSDRALVGKMVPPQAVSARVLELPEPAFGLVAPGEASDPIGSDAPQRQAASAKRDLSVAAFTPGTDTEQGDAQTRVPIVPENLRPDHPSGVPEANPTFDDGEKAAAALARVSAPDIFAPEFDLPFPLFGADLDIELALVEIAPLVPIEAEASDSESERALAKSEAPAEMQIAAEYRPEQDAEQIARAQPTAPLSFKDPGRLAQMPVATLQPPGAQPLARTSADLARSAVPGTGSTSLPLAAKPQGITRSRSIPLADRLGPKDAQTAGGPSQSRPAAAKAALADDAGSGKDADGNSQPAAARSIEASPDQPSGSADGASSGPVNYLDLPQAKRARTSIRPLLPEQGASTRTSIFSGVAKSSGPTATDAQGTAKSNPAMAQVEQTDFTPGRQTFPARDGSPPFTYEDELILQIQVAGISVTDTIIAYGNRDGVYLPLGEMGRILDLAIRVSDEGHYASGWFLSEDRTLTVDLRNGTLTTAAGTRPIPPTFAVAFDDEMFLRAEGFNDLLPLKVEANLRAQRVVLTTLEPFPFEERMRRDSERAKLNARNALPQQIQWPRQDTPYLPLSFPMADIELRAVSDQIRGERAAVDLRLSGDLAWMTAQSFLSATTRDGLVAALLELGRRDPDGELLGPMKATEFQLGDVSTTSMTLGLRGTAGRGAFVTNQPFESVSVFDRIDLRGVLPDGYEVELYRNDILLGSTRDAINGQYEFLEVPVDYGLNVFRLVFYGPQGQRREEVRRLSVGDGRLAQGQLIYSLGAIQRGVNLLGVTGPDFRPADRYGDLQSVAELAYGLTPALTAVANAALFEDNGEGRWLAGLGLRSGLGGFALRADAGLSDGGGHGVGLGIGGRALNGAFTLSHFEYGGGFLDEIRAFTSQPLRRATELDFNTSLNLGGAISGTYLPITFRGRHLEFASGQKQTNATLRSSMRIPGMIASSTLEFSRNVTPFGTSITQLLGNFDLATFNRSDVQLRGSLGYKLAPDPEITTVAAEANYAVDDKTVVRGAAAYSFVGDELSLGLSAIREFERFTVALDGRYGVRENDLSVALRFGFSLGRDPRSRRVFMHRPGLASSGAVSARIFHDVDGNGVYGPTDKLLPGVNLAVYNNTAESDDEGLARLGELGDGNRVTVQVDPSTLPDILMAPVNRGIEIVPRAGRFHETDFAIVELSEIEGTVAFGDDEEGRGVSGLRLQLVDQAGQARHFVRTERGGYFFFEEVKPGTYEIVIDPEQAERLNICLGQEERLTVSPSGDVLSRDLRVRECAVPVEREVSESPPAAREAELMATP